MLVCVYALFRNIRLAHTVLCCTVLFMYGSTLQELGYLYKCTHLAGLKVKVQGNIMPSLCYSYALSSFTKTPIHLDYKPLVAWSLTQEHMRCYLLRNGDRLKGLIDSFTQAIAIVVVNTQNSYELMPEFTVGMVETQTPIVILMKHEGIKLIELLNQQRRTHNFQARIDIESVDDHKNIAQLSEKPSSWDVKESVSQPQGLAQGEKNK